MKNREEKPSLVSVTNKREIPYAAFQELMAKTEGYMNDKAIADPSYFKTLTPHALEQAAVKSLKEVCLSTPFHPDNFELVSGHTFPDIVAATYYGVEVKSVKSDHWKSTGSSIMESTRDSNVQDIYMLFGKLGGVPEFRCRPYQDCLYDITVTHLPRYLIDMNTEAQNTIFSKMGTNYDAFRTSDQSIAQVREYYRQQSLNSKKKEMPWWLHDNEDDNNIVMFRAWSSLSAVEKEKLCAQIILLFPKAVLGNNYEDISMFMVSCHQVVCHNCRDLMSAGGKWLYIDGKELLEPLPAVVSRFLTYAKHLKEHAKDYKDYIAIYNPDILQKRKDPYKLWVEQIHNLLKDRFGFPDFKGWVNTNAKLSR